jgi:hypothetical protein
MAATAPTVISGVSPSLLNAPARGDARERGTSTLRRGTQECCLEARRQSAAEASSGAQLGWPCVTVGRGDEGHRAGDGDDRRDPLGDRRVRRERALVRAVDHHGVLPGGEARDDAASLDAAQRRDERSRVLGQPHGFRVGDELARRGDQQSREVAAVDGEPAQKHHDEDEHDQRGQQHGQDRKRASCLEPLHALRAGPRLQQFQRVEAYVGGRDQADVSVHDMDDLVRRDGCQLVVVQSVDQPAREDEHGILLPNTAGEGVERRTVDGDIRDRQACRDCQRLDDAAEPRLVLVVDETEIRPATNGADVPPHLHDEQQGADDGDDRHPTDEVSRPPVERRMLGIVHGERHQKRQHGEQVKRRDERREQRERTHVIAADVSVKPVHPHGAALQPFPIEMNRIYPAT